MEAIGLIGIVVALAFLVAAIYKGYSLVIAAPLAMTFGGVNAREQSKRPGFPTN